MKAIEKVAYLKGLLEGLDVKESKEEKIYSAIVDVLEDLALSLEDVEDGLDEVFELVDTIDEDLGNLEEDFYECDCDDDCCDCDDDDCCDGDCGEFAVKCPSCEQEIVFDLDVLQDLKEFECPFCGEVLTLTDDDCDSDCDCGCDHD
ncbi:MAG: CD1247 N-terminal domain-containing protein [Oscillospiraceae bacterium]